MVTVTFKITPELKQELEQTAKQEDNSQSQIVRRALREFFKTHPAEITPDSRNANP